MNSPALFRTTAGGAFVAHTATIAGDVRLGAGANVWFGAVLRGDVAPIIIGANANFQDGVIVHCDFEVPLTIEDDVVVGHAAVVHGKRVGARVLVGIGARLLTDSDIGEDSIIAAGSVVPPGMIVPPRSLVMGIPGRVVRSVKPEEIERTRMTNGRYRMLARQYAAGEFAWI